MITCQARTKTPCQNKPSDDSIYCRIHHNPNRKKYEIQRQQVKDARLAKINRQLKARPFFYQWVDSSQEIALARLSIEIFINSLDSDQDLCKKAITISKMVERVHRSVLRYAKIDKILQETLYDAESMELYADVIETIILIYVDPAYHVEVSQALKDACP